MNDRINRIELTAQIAARDEALRQELLLFVPVCNMMHDMGLDPEVDPVPGRLVVDRMVGDLLTRAEDFESTGDYVMAEALVQRVLALTCRSARRRNWRDVSVRRSMCLARDHGYALLKRIYRLQGRLDELPAGAR